METATSLLDLGPLGFSHVTEKFSLMERLHHPWCQTGQTLTYILPQQMIRMVHPLQLVRPLQMVHMAVPRQLTDVPRVPNRPGYVSPREIVPLPKCSPRTQTKRKHVKTAIITDTPEKQAIEKAYKESQKKPAEKKQNGKEKGKPKKKAPKKKIVVSSSEESDVPVPLDDVSDEESSEDERSDPGNTDLSVGDFVIVNFATVAYS